MRNQDRAVMFALTMRQILSRCSNVMVDNNRNAVKLLEFLQAESCEGVEPVAERRMGHRSSTPSMMMTMTKTMFPMKKILLDSAASTGDNDDDVMAAIPVASSDASDGIFGYILVHGKAQAAALDAQVDVCLQLMSGGVVSLLAEHLNPLRIEHSRCAVVYDDLSTTTAVDAAVTNALAAELMYAFCGQLAIATQAAALERMWQALMSSSSNSSSGSSPEVDQQRLVHFDALLQSRQRMQALILQHNLDYLSDYLANIASCRELTSYFMTVLRQVFACVVLVSAPSTFSTATATNTMTTALNSFGPTVIGLSFTDDDFGSSSTMMNMSSTSTHWKLFVSQHDGDSAVLVDVAFSNSCVCNRTTKIVCLARNASKAREIVIRSVSHSRHSQGSSTGSLSSLLKDIPESIYGSKNNLVSYEAAHMQSPIAANFEKAVLFALSTLPLRM